MIASHCNFGHVGCTLCTFLLFILLNVLYTCSFFKKCNFLLSSWETNLCASSIIGLFGDTSIALVFLCLGVN